RLDQLRAVAHPPDAGARGERAAAARRGQLASGRRRSTANTAARRRFWRLGDRERGRGRYQDSARRESSGPELAAAAVRLWTGSLRPDLGARPRASVADSAAIRTAPKVAGAGGG